LNGKDKGKVGLMDGEAFKTVRGKKKPKETKRKQKKKKKKKKAKREGQVGFRLALSVESTRTKRAQQAQPQIRCRAASLFANGAWVHFCSARNCGIAKEVVLANQRGGEGGAVLG
jgi:hypothetical protein